MFINIEETKRQLYWFGEHKVNFLCNVKVRPSMKCFVSGVRFVLFADNALAVGAARQRGGRLAGDKGKSLQRDRLFSLPSRRAGGAEEGRRKRRDHPL